MQGKLSAELSSLPSPINLDQRCLAAFRALPCLHFLHCLRLSNMSLLLEETKNLGFTTFSRLMLHTFNNINLYGRLKHELQLLWFIKCAWTECGICKLCSTLKCTYCGKNMSDIVSSSRIPFRWTSKSWCKLCRFHYLIKNFKFINSVNQQSSVY